jgi:hypothetical protein
MTTTPTLAADHDAALRAALPAPLARVFDLLADYPIPTELVAAIYNAGNAVPEDRTGTRALTVTRALLAAVDAVPRTEGRYVGTRDTDAAPDLPALDESGLIVGTPAPPDRLPARRLLLWEWATDTPLADQMTDAPDADAWPAFPLPALILDHYGADPRPWARFAVHAHQAHAALAPYDDAIRALASIATLHADTAAPVTAAQIADLITRSRDSHDLPAFVAARRLVITPHAGLADLAALAIRTRTAWTRDGLGYPTGTYLVHDVPHPAFASLASRLAMALPHLNADQVADLARRSVAGAPALTASGHADVGPARQSR